jgi:hypothetical protein
VELEANRNEVVQIRELPEGWEWNGKGVGQIAVWNLAALVLGTGLEL